MITIKVHPSAEHYPMLDDAELRPLANDIKRTGLRQKITIYPDFDDDDVMILLDGRNRLAALELLGWPIFGPDGIPNPEYFVLADEGAQAAPEAYINSLNLHRRHLNTEKKRAVIAMILTTDPRASDRRIARAAHVDNKTVAAVREEMEGREEIPHVDAVTDTKGRKQPSGRTARRAAANGRSSRAKATAVPARSKARAGSSKEKAWQMVADFTRLAANCHDVGLEALLAGRKENERTNVVGHIRVVGAWVAANLKEPSDT